MLLSQKQIKIILIGTLIGGISQLICMQYIKNHPEFLEELNTNHTNPSTKVPSLVSPRGGAGIEIIGLKSVPNILIKLAVKSMAVKGILISLLTSTLISLTTIPSTAISTYLRDAFIQNLPHLENQKVIKVSDYTIELDPSDKSLEFLYLLLKDKNLSFDEKEEIAFSILESHLDLDTLDGRVRFLLCLLFILLMFCPSSMAEYYIILRILKKGKRIPRAVVIAIIRKLRRKGLPLY